MKCLIKQSIQKAKAERALAAKYRACCHRERKRKLFADALAFVFFWNIIKLHNE